jgi:Ca2+-binding RTX toxin-like protein
LLRKSIVTLPGPLAPALLLDVQEQPLGPIIESSSREVLTFEISLAAGEVWHGTVNSDDHTGTAEDDMLYGHGGADKLYGGAGKDTLMGGVGGDALDGGEGLDDIASYEDYITTNPDRVTGLVIDLETPSNSTGDAQGDTYTNIEVFVGSAYNDTFVGSDAADSFWGHNGDDVIRTGAGADSLNGQTGNDTLEGGLDGDTLDGGDGFDYVSYAHAAANDQGIGVTVNLRDSTFNRGEAAGDTFVSIEGIIGSDHSDGLSGNDADNVLDGGKGADVLLGGLGNDTYIVDNPDDTVNEYVDQGYDTIIVYGNAQFDNYSLANPAYPFLRNVEVLQAGAGTFKMDLYGNDSGNKLIGNDGENFIDGGYGADIMIGGKGNDTYVVDDVWDVVAENAGQGTDKVVISRNSHIENYTLSANVEDLHFGGWLEDGWNRTVIGNALNNVIMIEGYADDVINGGAGADTMQGEMGNDVYYVDNVRDKIIEVDNDFNPFAPSSASNSLRHTDTVITTASYTLGAYVENMTASGKAAIKLTGNGLANVLTGNSGKNTLSASSGNDTLKGGSGNDTLYGGTGQDVFVFNKTLSARTNKDSIRDWNYRDDTIQLENAVFKALKTVGPLSRTAFVLGSKAKDSNDFIGYNKTTGDVWYDANGSKAGGQVTFANIGKYKAIAHNDFIVI